MNEIGLTLADAAAPPGARLRARIGAWGRSLLPWRRFLNERDAVGLPPEDLRAAGPIFKNDRVFRSFAVRDVAAMERHVRLAGKSILDFGCGTGRLYFGLRVHNEPASYLGVDVKEDVIAWARRNVSAANGKFAFVRADIHNERYNPRGALDNNAWGLALGDRFDVVYCYSVLSHLTEPDADAVLDLFARQSGAVIFLTAFVAEQAEDIVVNPREAGIAICGPLHVVRYRRDYFRDKLLQKFEIVADYAGLATDGQAFYVLRSKGPTAPPPAAGSD